VSSESQDLALHSKRTFVDDTIRSPCLGSEAETEAETDEAETKAEAGEKDPLRSPFFGPEVDKRICKD
jgi:hypothetical protein